MNAPRSNPFAARTALAARAALCGLTTLAAHAPAQSARPAFLPLPLLASDHETLALSRAQTLARMETPVEIRLAEHPLHDVIRYLALVAEVPLDPLWIDDRPDAPKTIGLDPMTPITLNTQGLTVLQAIEVTLDLAADAQRLDFGATWQFSPTGTIELGPRERLNRPAACRTEVYDVQDLLTILPEPPDAPRLDASTAGQPLGPGSGPDQWVFPSDNTLAPPPARPDRAANFRDFIMAMVETPQWEPNGGPAIIQIYEGALVIHAPDYIHRALVGPLGEPARSKSE